MDLEQREPTRARLNPLGVSDIGEKPEIKFLIWESGVIFLIGSSLIQWCRAGVPLSRRCVPLKNGGGGGDGPGLQSAVNRKRVAGHSIGLCRQ